MIVEMRANSEAEIYRVIHGNGARMSLLRDGEADLIVTSPPYFPESLMSLLQRNEASEDDTDELQRGLVTFALSLRPVFAEMTRVNYDITRYQPVLFAARSLTHCYDALEGLLTSFSDETPARLATTAA